MGEQDSMLPLLCGSAEPYLRCPFRQRTSSSNNGRSDERHGLVRCRPSTNKPMDKSTLLQYWLAVSEPDLALQCASRRTQGWGRRAGLGTSDRGNLNLPGARASHEFMRGRNLKAWTSGIQADRPGDRRGPDEGRWAGHFPVLLASKPQRPPGPASARFTSSEKPQVTYR